MKVSFKIKLTQLKMKIKSLYEYSKKIAFAVVITEYIIAGSYYMLESKGYLDFLQPKTIIIEVAKADEQKYERDEPVTTNIDEIVSKVYRLESSRGKADSCKAKGMFNGFGFGVYGTRRSCFKSYEEVRQKVYDWFQDKIQKGYTKEESLCVYNTGKKVSDCDYLTKYNEL